MERKSTPFALGALLLAAAMPATAQENAANAGDRPNILLIVADDLGYSDLGVFGGEIASPNLDAMARSGMMFTNFHAQASCSPTRSMLLTGQDNHRAGLGAMRESLKLRAGPGAVARPGYEGVLRGTRPYLPELLHDAGYHTVMAGKWHLADPEVQAPDTMPQGVGFDHSFALMQGGAAHYKQTNMNFLSFEDRIDWVEDGKTVELPDDFYSTTFITDYIIDHLPAGEEPFFAYAAYTAPHWPVQAPEADMAKYKGRYDAGYQAIQAERQARRAELGLTRPGDPDSPSIEGADWSALSADEQAYEAREMEAYAGMVTALDREIGRLIDHLRDIGEYDNTLILFISDNGAEGINRGGKWAAETFDQSYENIGRPNSFVEMSQGWAQVSTTPNRMFKLTTYEGGVRVPGFAVWPGHAVQGRSDALLSVTDILPTLVEISGAQDPATDRIGHSILPVLADPDAAIRSETDPLGWEIVRDAAYREGDWRIVYTRDRQDQEKGNWGLFHLSGEGGEWNNLVESQPEKFEQMMDGWRAYSEANGIALRPDGSPEWFYQ